MTTKQIEKLAHGEPFKPFRVVLTNGEEVTVTKPRKSSVSGDQLAAVGVTRYPNGAGREGLRLILIDQIVSASTIDSQANT